MLRIVLPACLALSLSGCIAHTAYDVATLPVRATSKVVDWTTTSRAEADRNYGRKMRKQHELEAREARREAKQAHKAERAGRSSGNAPS
jgi:hypothetical protein